MWPERPLAPRTPRRTVVERSGPGLFRSSPRLRIFCAAPVLCLDAGTLAANSTHTWSNAASRRPSVEHMQVWRRPLVSATATIRAMRMARHVAWHGRPESSGPQADAGQAMALLREGGGAQGRCRLTSRPLVDRRGRLPLPAAKLLRSRLRPRWPDPGQRDTSSMGGLLDLAVRAAA